MKTDLYRHYNGDNTLLYVGISLSAINRLIQHKGSSEWFDEIKRIDVEKFDTREEALIAETKAIQSEKPFYNIKKKSIVKKSRLNEHVEEAQIDLVSRVVNYKIFYTDEEVADILMTNKYNIRKWIASNKLGAIVQEKTRNTAHGIRTIKKYFISGWQLIDFIEHCQMEKKFPEVTQMNYD